MPPTAATHAASHVPPPAGDPFSFVGVEGDGPIFAAPQSAGRQPACVANIGTVPPPLDVLQEYSDNRGVALRVDRQRGLIQGVKLLGTLSKKGREYPPAVIAKAAPMYEGMRVNIDHVDPGQRRSLRDRIGIVKNVSVKEDGLYGDFYFNPKHGLAEQIAWDAENAPQNLGFSHDTRGVVRNLGSRAVVESIEKVLSVDLVANPATTDGLFEDDARDCPSFRPSESGTVPFSGGGKGDSPIFVDTKIGTVPADLARLTLDELRNRRPDLVAALQESLDSGDELRRLRETVHALRSEQAARQLDETLAGQLKAAGLDPANKVHCSEVFLEDLRGTADPARRQAKIDDRRALVAARPTSAAPTTGSVAMLEALDALPAAATLADRVRNWSR
jgi:hypothetical protein